MDRKMKRKGQAIIELALLFPFFLLLIANVINYGGMFYAAITIANAARHASQNYIYGSATVRNTRTPTAAQVWTIAQQDTLALPNKTSLGVRVCLENRGTPSSPVCQSFGPTANASFYSNPPIDPRPEGDAFLNGWVDVSYVYQPYVPLFTVPVLGIPLAPPPQSMVRQSLMRVLN